MIWLEGPYAQALSSTLLHFLWEGTLIALVLAVALRIVRGSAETRYNLSVLAMLAMPLAFVVTFGVTLRDHPGQAVVAAGSAAVAAPHALPPGWPPVLTIEAVESGLPWVVPIWVAGVLACYLRGLVGWLAVTRLRRTGLCPAPAEWHERFVSLARQLRVSPPVRLFESALAEVPVAIGFLRPIILVPAGLLTGLPASQVEAILIHELAHIRRRDYLVNLAQSLIEGLLFYHPAVWWVGRVIRAERENCCDDTVLAVAGDPRGYAAALATLEEIRCGSRQFALAATGGSLMTRIRRILRQPEPASAVGPAVFSGILLVLAAAVLAAWPVETPEPAPQSPAPPQLKTGGPLSNVGGPYYKWLTEDVAYIITDEERAAVRRLTSDRDRDRFIEQFWTRRDPTPGTDLNEFKVEYYRRIAYANELFADARVPGWKTDRGRIYITYGPADEVESHPGGKADKPPYEIWRYRYLEGIGNDVLIEFVDTNRNREYRITPDPRYQRPPQLRPPLPR